MNEVQFDEPKAQSHVFSQRQKYGFIGNLFLKMGVSKGEDGLNAVMLGVAMIFFFLGVMVLAFS